MKKMTCGFLLLINYKMGKIISVIQGNISFSHTLVIGLYSVPHLLGKKVDTLDGVYIN